MKSVAIKINRYAGNVNVISGFLNTRALKIILGSFGVLALSYVLVVGSMIVNIIERKSLETQARVLSEEVANLELSYLASANEIDLSFGYALGFKETKAAFATRKSLGMAGRESDSGDLVLGNNEI